MNPLYATHRLDQNEDQIRLFHVKLDSWDTLIEGTFSVMNLHQSPKFIALSYAWGNPTMAVASTVKVHDHFVPVSHNLYEALRRLRWHAYYAEYPKELVIWADALCICQEDAKEKQHQVPLMRRIYSTCQYTAVWLGELTHIDMVTASSPTTHDALTIDTQYSNALEGSSDPIKLSSRLIVKLHEGEHLTAIKPFDRDENDPLFTDMQKILRSLGRNTWFRRRWVLQEAILAPVVKVFFGETSMDLDFLSQAMDKYAHHIDQSCCTTSEPGHYLMRRSIRTFLQEFTSLRYFRHIRGSEAHILSLCREFADRETTLEADRVYSLLGLTEPPSNIHPDYTLPLHNLFTDICTDYIEKTRSLDFLPFAGIHKSWKKLPSWVVDWTRPENSWTWLTALFNSAGSLSQTPLVHRETMLQILGYQIDVIE